MESDDPKRCYRAHKLQHRVRRLEPTTFEPFKLQSWDSFLGDYDASDHEHVFDPVSSGRTVCHSSHSETLNIWAVLKCLNGFCKTKLGPVTSVKIWQTDSLNTKSQICTHLYNRWQSSLPSGLNLRLFPNSTQWQSPGNRPTPTSTNSTTPSKSSTPWGKPVSSRACSPLQSKTTVSLCSEPLQTHTVTHRSVLWFILKHQEQCFLSTADEPCRSGYSTKF